MIIYLFVFCSIFKLLTELKEDNLGDDFPVISLFQKRRHIEKDGDIPIHQLNSETWGMGAYLAILEEGEDNSEGLQKLANIVCTKMNVFASKSKSNCNPISYKGNLTEGLTEENRKVLIITLSLSMWLNLLGITTQKKLMLILFLLMLI